MTFMRKAFSALLAVALRAGISVPVSAYNAATVEPRGQLISAGASNSAAIDKDGFIWMWGRCRPGDEFLDYGEIPKKYMGNVKSVSCGWYSPCIIMNDGSLWMWGKNDWGQIGNGKPNGEEWVASPVKVLDNVLSVSNSSINTAAVLEDHSLWMWGSVSGIGNGIPGNDTTEYGTKIQTTPVKVMDNAMAVSCGYCTAVIKDDRSLWIWGYWIDQTEVKEPIKLMDDVVSVSCGESHIAIITSDGSLWMWGNNWNGALGVVGYTEIKNEPIKVFDNVSQAVAGARTTAAILTDGTLWVWGDNTFRSLTGQDATGSTGGSQLTPLKIMDEVHSVSMGHHFAIVEKNDGSLWAWGENFYGQIGNDGKGDIKAYGGGAIMGSEQTSISGKGNLLGYVQSTPTQITLRDQIILTDFSAAPIVTVNGDPIVWTNDAKPFIDENGRTLVPLHAVADVLGIATSWNESTQTASFSGDAHYGVIRFTIGSTTTKTSYGDIEMDTAPVIVNNRTYAPIRYLAEFFQFTVDWDNSTRTVLIAGYPSTIWRG